MMNFCLRMDPKISISVRSSIQILDYIGNIGGYMGALTLVFGFIGFYLSDKFYISSLSKELFIARVKQFDKK